MNEARYKPFLQEIEAAASSRMLADVFADAVHGMACAIWGRVSMGKAHADNEADYAALKARYTPAEFAHFGVAFARLIEALEETREEFLGHVLEHIGANNVRNGQFLTPVCLAQMLGKLSAPAAPAQGGEVIRINDPCCGAGVLLIQGAEELRAAGWRQADIMVDAGDLDARACDMAYVQLSLLGYGAVVRCQNALTRQYFGPAPVRYTPGWYLHSFPMRGVAA